MERIEPTPADTSAVVVWKYPLETLDVSLTDLRLYLIHLRLWFYEKFSPIVSVSPSFCSKLNVVNIGFNLSRFFFFLHAWNFIFKCLFHYLWPFFISQIFFLKLLFNLLSRFAFSFFRSQFWPSSMTSPGIILESKTILLSLIVSFSVSHHFYLSHSEKFIFDFSYS